MKVISNTSLEDFEFYEGAKDLTNCLTTKQMAQVESILEEEYPDGITDQDLNDLFAHDGDLIAEWLGYRDEEQILMQDDVSYLLKQSQNLLEEIRDEICPEFDESDLKEYFERTGTDLDLFLHKEQYKEYIAELSDCSVEEAENNDYFSDYEDTLKYLEYGYWMGRIDQQDTMSGTELDQLRNTVVDLLNDGKFYSRSSDLDNRIEWVSEHLNGAYIEKEEEREL